MIILWFTILYLHLPDMSIMSIMPIVPIVPIVPNFMIISLINIVNIVIAATIEIITIHRFLKIPYNLIYILNWLYYILSLIQWLPFLRFLTVSLMPGLRYWQLLPHKLMSKLQYVPTLQLINLPILMPEIKIIANYCIILSICILFVCRLLLFVLTIKLFVFLFLFLFDDE